MVYLSGDFVLRCTPFAYIVKNQYLAKICDYCFKPDEQQTPLKKCSNCKIIHYCNVNCQRHAWKNHHKGVECKYLKKIFPHIPPEIVRITIRTILRYICKINEILQLGLVQFLEIILRIFFFTIINDSLL